MNTTLTRMNSMLSQGFADIASPGAYMDDCGLWLVVTDLDAWYELRDGTARPTYIGDVSDITLEQARAAAAALRDERARKNREEAARTVQAQRDAWMRYVAQQNDERLQYRHPLKPQHLHRVMNAWVALSLAAAS
ncbi:hypothetical protein OKW43_007759 [Paraburkholderia sp. WC7.3g]|uniref:hypothetical protein n=1 Tax=Paraburkholderia sp. WC7.3g TaxID=2991070 RepID=UPI003D1F56A6